MRLIIFDCDGTLVDSQHIIYRAMSEAFLTSGLAAPEKDAVRSVIGLSLVEAVSACLPAPDAADPTLVAERYKSAFVSLKTDPKNEEPLFDGVKDILSQLNAEPHSLLAVATGKSQRGMARLFKREGFGPYFQSVQTADEHPSKPHPSMIRRAMAQAGVGAEDTVMIGDTIYDMEMARNAGVPAIGVAWGYHPVPQLVASGANSIAAEFADLPGHIGQALQQNVDE